MKMLFCAFTVLASLSLLACADKRVVWVATRDTSVYVSDSDTEERVAFMLSPGDVCTPIREVVMKAYLHTEIRCKKGNGWVVDKLNFDIRPAP